MDLIEEVLSVKDKLEIHPREKVDEWMRACFDPTPASVSRPVKLEKPLTADEIERINSSLGIKQPMLERFEFVPPADTKLLIMIGRKDRRQDDDYLDPIMMRCDAAWAFQKLQETAAIEGVLIRPLSGYRSPRHQANIIARKLDRGVEIQEILKVNTPPGYSEHGGGGTIDVGGKDQAHDLEQSFENTKEGKWLRDNAHRFGFALTYDRDNKWGIIYEPWHITYHTAKDPQFSFFADNSDLAASSTLYQSINNLPGRVLSEDEFKLRVAARRGEGDHIPLIPELCKFPQGDLVIQDSKMTLEEAFRYTPPDWPDQILARLELINIYYYGFDMQLHQGQLVVDYRLIPDILGFFELARYLKIPSHAAIPISHESIKGDDKIAMKNSITHCFNPRVIAGKEIVSPHGFGQALDFSQDPNTDFGYIDQDGNTYKFPPKDIVTQYYSHPENAAARACHLSNLYFPALRGEKPFQHPLVAYMRSKGWRYGGDFDSTYDTHHFQKRLHRKPPTLADVRKGIIEEL